VSAMTEVKPVALSDRIRREGDLSSRAGQLDRLYGLADEVDALRVEVEGLRADAELLRDALRESLDCMAYVSPHHQDAPGWLGRGDAIAKARAALARITPAKEAQDGR